MKLALGTVQFGLAYGISNAAGKTPPDEVKNLLKVSSSAGIDLLDTASLYGDSEATLGKTLSENPLPFRIVTKTPRSGKKAIDSTTVAEWKSAFSRSLELLRMDSLYGLLVHSAGDLITDGSEALWKQMEEWKNSGKVKKIGASVYDAREIDEVLKRYSIDLIQLPLSILDQRLIRSGHLKKLRDRGVEIHVRSAFLQGLVFLDPSRLPSHFDSAKPQLTALQAFAAKIERPIAQVALGFAQALPEVDSVVCGVNNVAQLEELVHFAGWKPNADEMRLMGEFAIDTPSILNPSEWPRNP